MTGKDIIKKEKRNETNFIEEELQESSKLEQENKIEPSENLLFIREMIEKIFQVDSIEMRTEFASKEIPIFACAMVYAEYFQDDILKSFIQWNMRAKLSTKRKSREELIKIITQGYQEQAPINDGLGSQLFGKGI